ncbi:MAG: M23 family metallopeptidase, partial [Parvularculaceae bacterium]
IIGQYGAGLMGRRNDGVNIAAPVGTPVRASADGEVVYRGSDLDGYGNLLLIKHGDGFVTAYAHNDAMLVKKGDLVRQGQVIAKVGQTGAATVPQLHFEIRQDLKSVDPLGFLQN